MKLKGQRLNLFLLLSSLALAALFFGDRCIASQPEAAEKLPTEKRQLEVIFFNVYHGDATLINTPDGKHILIDGGKCRTPWSSFDAGEHVIIPYLRKNGIKRLDLVIGTHPHLDHIGGLTTLLRDKGIEVGCYIDPGKEHTTRYYQELLELVKERGIPYKIGRAGQKLDFGQGVSAEILNPRGLFPKNNDCSIVIRMKYGKASFLFTGDAEEAAEVSMKSRYGYKLSSTVLRVGHHGSRTSTGRAFLGYVSPKIAVISCSTPRSKSSHPHEEVLRRLRYIRAKIYTTYEMGTIIVRTDGKTLVISKLIG